MLAELLDLPFISCASKLEVEGGKNIITRDIEGGIEVIEVDGPFVISAAKGLAEQRIPNMQGIMMSKRKPLDVVAPVMVEPLTSVVTHTLPNLKTGVKLLQSDQMDELVRLLHEESKVI
jgi:electron transfer flavoprotein beta subunit